MQDLTQSDFGHLSVLILEDEFVIAMDIEDQLLSWGCRSVELARNTSEARERIASGSIDLLLADFNLGPETSEALVCELSSKAAPAVALLTGQALSLEQIERMGSPLIVQKPVQPAQLRAVVEELTMV